jgi:aminoglycoside N3'-acetyltransferase
MTNCIENILQTLKPPKAKYVFCHIAINALQLSPQARLNLFEEIYEYFGDATVVLPSYPFSTNTDYSQYIAQDKIEFDTEKSPCKINLIGEIFRRRPQSVRSGHPLFPVAAEGLNAAKIVQNGERAYFPYDAQSCYAQLGDDDTIVLGLGVDIKTNAFIHLVDHYFRERLTEKMYLDNPIHARITLNEKTTVEGNYYCLSPLYRRSMNLEPLHTVIHDERFYSFLSGDVPCYSLVLNEFLEKTKVIASSYLNKGEALPWHG